MSSDSDSEPNNTKNNMQLDDESSSSENTSTSEESQSHSATKRPAPQLNATKVMTNNPNDEQYRVNDNRYVQTPTSMGGVGGNRPDRLNPNAVGAAAGGNMMNNNPNDERLEVQGADVVQTPMANIGQTRNADLNAVGSVMHNEPHDEAMVVDGDRVPTPANAFNGTVAGGRLNYAGEASTSEHEEEEEEEDEDEPGQQVGGFGGQRPNELQEGAGGNMTGADAAPDVTEFNPEIYARVNEKASREMQDLFRRITEYEPFVAELPAKLYPFIPDFFPAIGDLDPFVKVPRPDGRPDGLGLYVVDEPAIPQSNPAVVQLELRATHAHTAGVAQVVDSFEDAENRPEILDRWIADIKKVHYKKALPTVAYQKPMPEIESLLQIWPQDFEDVLNSDLQFPPPGVDLDMEQYVRTLCAIVDIPTYSSLIDALHVMFTVYEEFRTNQHFQHE